MNEKTLDYIVMTVIVFVIAFLSLWLLNMPPQSSVWQAIK